MNEQIGWRALLHSIKDEAPRYAQLIPQLPRLLHDALQAHTRPPPQHEALLLALVQEQRRTNRLLQTALALVGGFVLGGVFVRWLLPGLAHALQRLW
jgi:ubiquinone biosynthesis protein